MPLSLHDILASDKPSVSNGAQHQGRTKPWYQLSDPGAEEALYDIQSMRAFAGLELGRDAIPDETTILNFRHLLEAHDLTKAIFEAVSAQPTMSGAMTSCKTRPRTNDPFGC